MNKYEEKYINNLKNKIQNNFNFDIPDYILDVILESDYYNNVCLFINMARITNRISEDNSIMLKNKIKTMFKINNNYDRCDFKYFENNF